MTALRASIDAILSDALATAPGSNWTTVRVHASPLTIEVVAHDGAGRTLATYRAAGDAGVAEALAAFLEDCRSAMPSSMRTRLGAVLAAGGAGLVAILDLTTHAAHVVLVPAGDTDAVLLATRAAPEICH